MEYNTLFEDCNLQGYTPKQIMNGKKLYDYLNESFEKAAEESDSIDNVMDEGLFGALVGGAAGATIGPAIMKSVCKALGIDEKGALGSLLTSKLVVGAVGAQLGYKI